MSWWEAALLGLVQGLTEFLPVSSSGHLVLGKHLLGLTIAEEDALAFDIFVHFGTVLSILTVYWSEVFRIVRECALAAIRPGAFVETYRSSDAVRLGVFILITLIPTGIVYLVFREPLEAAFDNPKLVSGMLLVTGLLLLLTLLRRHPTGKLTPLKAFVIGLAQSSAMIPGISRSGATICTALYQNVKPERAADFSFLMLLPVVIGATLVKSVGIGSTGLVMGWLPVLTGTLTAYVSGVVAIKLMLASVRRGKLQYFAIYVFLIGIAGLVFF
jgi:undecaprenyl-diphosphatase